MADKQLYAIAPLGLDPRKCHFITPGKAYEVIYNKDYGETGFNFVDDEGDTITGLWDANDLHLTGLRWTKAEGCKHCNAPPVTELDGAWLCHEHACKWVAAEGLMDEPEPESAHD